MSTTDANIRRLAVAVVAAAFITSLIPMLALASSAVSPGAAEVGAPATTSPGAFNTEGNISIEGGAALGMLDAGPLVWSVILLAILGVVSWGVYRYSATTAP